MYPLVNNGLEHEAQKRAVELILIWHITPTSPHQIIGTLISVQITSRKDSLQRIVGIDLSHIFSDFRDNTQF